MLSRFMIKSAAFVAFAVLGAHSAQAAAVRIECPLQKVRTEITSPLPSGWWQTPQVGSLQETRIANIRGDKTLMCGYWAFEKTVYIMQKAPASMQCRKDARGFDCQSPGVVSNAPRTHSTGGVDLKQTWIVDLDNGSVGGNGGGGDIWFQAKTATARYLTPRNGARIAVAGSGSVGLSGCRNAGYTANPIGIPPVGTYVCVRTSEGRYSQFRINGGPGRSPGLLKIGYTTWAN